MVQFISNYNLNVKEAECYIDIQNNTKENNFQIVFLEPSIIFGDKKAVFSLPNYCIDYRYGFTDEDLMEIVNYIKLNINLIYNKLYEGLEKYKIGD